MEKKVKKNMFKKLICVFCQKYIDVNNNSHKCERRISDHIIIYST